MEFEWIEHNKKNSDFVVSDQISKEDNNSVIFSNIADKIGLVLKHGSYEDNHSYFTLGGKIHNEIQFLLIATSQEKSVLIDTVSKTVFEGLNQENFEVFSNIDEVKDRNNFFKSTIERDFKLAKDMLVKRRSANEERPRNNEDLKPINFAVIVKDHENYLHWASQGKIKLMGLNHEVINILEMEENELTHRTISSNINFGYSKSNFDFIISASEESLDHLNVKMFHELNSDIVNFDKNVKTLLQTLENNVQSVHYGLINTN